MNVKLKRTAALALCVMMFAGCGANDPEAVYKKAYEKTEALKSYTIEIRTAVNATDNGVERSETTVQTVYASDVGGDEMIFKVDTKSLPEEPSGNDTSYTYYKNKYYISMPGVRYYSEADVASAQSTIENLTRIISLPYEKMYNVSETDGVYAYDVEGEDLTQLVMALLQTTADSFGDKQFKAENISASASVADGYVKSRHFEAKYTGADGDGIFSVTIDTSLLKKSAEIEKPDIKKYGKLN